MWRYRFQSPPQNSLSHYGIQGQKWGIRRFQNADGSYTQEGKERYGRGITGGLFNKNKVKLKALKEESYKAVQSNKELLTELSGKEKRFIKDLRDVGKEYENVFRTAKLSSQEKDRIWEKLHSDFGNGVDDDEFFDETVVEHLQNDVELWQEKAPKELDDKRKAIDVEARDIKSILEKVTQPVIDKYGDKRVEDIDQKNYPGTKNLIRQMISGYVLNNQWLSAYIFSDRPYSSDPSFYESKEYWNAVFVSLMSLLRMNTIVVMESKVIRLPQ